MHEFYTEIVDTVIPREEYHCTTALLCEEGKATWRSGSETARSLRGGLTTIGSGIHSMSRPTVAACRVDRLQQRVLLMGAIVRAPLWMGHD